MRLTLTVDVESLWSHCVRMFRVISGLVHGATKQQVVAELREGPSAVEAVGRPACSHSLHRFHRALFAPFLGRSMEIKMNSRIDQLQLELSAELSPPAGTCSPMLEPYGLLEKSL